MSGELIKRPDPEEAALWRAYADLQNKYVVDPAMKKLKLAKKPGRKFFMAGEAGRVGSVGADL